MTNQNNFDQERARKIFAEDDEGSAQAHAKRVFNDPTTVADSLEQVENAFADPNTIKQRNLISDNLAHFLVKDDFKQDFRTHSSSRYGAATTPSPSAPTSFTPTGSFQSSPPNAELTTNVQNNTPLSSRSPTAPQLPPHLASRASAVQAQALAQQAQAAKTAKTQAFTTKNKKQLAKGAMPLLPEHPLITLDLVKSRWQEQCFGVSIPLFARHYELALLPETQAMRKVFLSTFEQAENLGKGEKLDLEQAKELVYPELAGLYLKSHAYSSSNNSTFYEYPARLNLFYSMVFAELNWQNLQIDIGDLISTNPESLSVHYHHLLWAWVESYVAFRALPEHQKYLDGKNNILNACSLNCLAQLWRQSQSNLTTASAKLKTLLLQASSSDEPKQAFISGTPVTTPTNQAKASSQQVNPLLAHAGLHPKPTKSYVSASKQDSSLLSSDALAISSSVQNDSTANAKKSTHSNSSSQDHNYNQSSNQSNSSQGNNQPLNKHLEVLPANYSYLQNYQEQHLTWLFIDALAGAIYREIVATETHIDYWDESCPANLRPYYEILVAALQQTAFGEWGLIIYGYRSLFSEFLAANNRSCSQYPGYPQQDSDIYSILNSFIEQYLPHAAPRLLHFKPQSSHEQRTVQALLPNQVKFHVGQYKQHDIAKVIRQLSTTNRSLLQNLVKERAYALHPDQRPVNFLQVLAQEQEYSKQICQQLFLNHPLEEEPWFTNIDWQGFFTQVLKNELTPDGQATTMETYHNKIATCFKKDIEILEQLMPLQFAEPCFLDSLENGAAYRAHFFLATALPQKAKKRMACFITGCIAPVCIAVFVLVMIGIFVS